MTADSDMGSDGTVTRRLRWRCRRGMRELDILMTRYLEHCWPHADAAARAAFLELLAVEDDRLWRRISGREAATDPAQAAVLAAMREYRGDTQAARA